MNPDSCEFPNCPGCMVCAIREGIVKTQAKGRLGSDVEGVFKRLERVLERATSKRARLHVETDKSVRWLSVQSVGGEQQRIAVVHLSDTVYPAVVETPEECYPVTDGFGLAAALSSALASEHTGRILRQIMTTSKTT